MNKRLVAKNNRCLEVYGCTYKQIADMRAHCRELARKGVTRDRQPLGAFGRQRQNARARGIEWQLKFWDWWEIWEASGRWDERGRGDGFVMARYGDQGPYSKENVFIEWARRNNSERKDKASDLPMGVVQMGSRFGAHCMKSGKMKWLGCHDNPDSAHLAYLIEVGSR